MSMLVILLAPRPRADASDADTALVHVLSHDGLAVARRTAARRR